MRRTCTALALVGLIEDASSVKHLAMYSYVIFQCVPSSESRLCGFERGSFTFRKPPTLTRGARVGGRGGYVHQPPSRAQNASNAFQNSDGCVLV